MYNKRVIEGILLDIDGTLVLSNDAHAESWVEALAEFGYEVAYEDVRQLIGMGGDKLMPTLVPGLEKESDIGSEISERRTQLFMEKYMPQLQPAPGSRALVERLRADGYKLMAASSAKQDELGVLLKAADIEDLLKEATTSSDAYSSKPDPDIVHAALDKIGMRPEQVLMIGDTPYDIESASKAGVQLVAVRCGGWPDEQLNGALAVYDDPADLLANYASSPFKKVS